MPRLLVDVCSESKEKALEEQSLSLEQLKQSRAELEEMQARWFRSVGRYTGVSYGAGTPTN